ncbi:hypothetical protein M413DRAFT_79204, partial [Hebeloma cylindrosporum]
TNQPTSNTMCTAAFTTTAVAVASYKSTAASTPTISESCINHSSPQCCHCGWRGAHSPNCPFK